MTQEEKAKRYNEAIEKLRGFYRDYDTVSRIIDVKEELANLIPELKESEDDMVRKEIIEFVDINTLSIDERHDKWIAWLKKQGEKKPILSEEDERIREALKEYFVNSFKNNGVAAICGVHIKDALAWLEKQGEQKPNNKVNLATKSYITPNSEFFQFIYDRLIYMHHENPDVDYMLSLKERIKDMQKPADNVEPKFNVGDWIVNKEHSYLIADIDYEQRRYLFEIGGYTHEQLNWEYIENADNKYHLWTIQDAKDGDVIYLPNGNNEYYLFIFKGIENAAVMSFAYFYQYNDGTSKVEGTNDNLFSVNDAFQPATKEQRDLLFSKMKEAGYEWNTEKKELRKIEQNPAWSEEDERNIDYIIDKLKTINDERHFICIFWLKSLKDRVLPQQEWSEEDEKKRNLLISILNVNHPNGYFKVNPANTLNMEAIYTEELVAWLKFLRPQSHWKPSDEQMEALETATCSLQSVALESLYRNLKQLK